MKITRRKFTTGTVALGAVTVVSIPVKLPLPPKPEPEIFYPIISEWNDVLAQYTPESMIEFLEAAEKEGLAVRKGKRKRSAKSKA